MSCAHMLPARVCGLQLHLSRPQLYVYSKADAITGYKHVAASVKKVSARVSR